MTATGVVSPPPDQPEEAGADEADYDDPLIEEVRAIRRRISAQFDHDIGRMIEYYMEFQKQFADRLVSYADTPKVEPPEDEPIA